MRDRASSISDHPSLISWIIKSKGEAHEVVPSTWMQLNRKNDIRPCRTAIFFLFYAFTNQLPPVRPRIRDWLTDTFNPPRPTPNTIHVQPIHDESIYSPVVTRTAFYSTTPLNDSRLTPLQLLPSKPAPCRRGWTRRRVGSLHLINKNKNNNKKVDEQGKKADVHARLWNIQQSTTPLGFSIPAPPCLVSSIVYPVQDNIQDTQGSHTSHSPFSFPMKFFLAIQGDITSDIHTCTLHPGIFQPFFFFERIESHYMTLLTGILTWANTCVWPWYARVPTCIQACCLQTSPSPS